ncbi:polyprenyl diphosphate synthase [Carnobacterium pleistocenium]|uniref:polyprenyl diphosphate synthase n=1 Tax=Carnobacterium pleistocenium TaxID=181073 RepID=UPI0005511398|nr:polyprenyl diphosphate synthase [Carnobacterium pleistocenium]
METYKRLPNHIGIIPDGNRRWAQKQGFEKKEGYKFGVEPGLELYHLCLALGIKEMTFYGFTVDNTKRPTEQTQAFQKACVDAVNVLKDKDAEILVIGNTDSPLFPKELLPYTKRTKSGKGLMKINFLINYGWSWDLNYGMKQANFDPKGDITKTIASSDISRMDLIIRWGGRRRLSGFLPVQSIYSDFYVADELWPDYNTSQVHAALQWYQDQDVTLGG